MTVDVFNALMVRCNIMYNIVGHLINPILQHICPDMLYIAA